MNEEYETDNFLNSDMQKVCRVCLEEFQNDGDTGVCLMEYLYQEKKLINLYTYVSSIEIKFHDFLPKKVCSTCYQKLIKFSLFKCKILKSEKILNNVFLYKIEKNNLEETTEIVEKITDNKGNESDTEFDFTFVSVSDKKNLSTNPNDDCDEKPLLSTLSEMGTCKSDEIVTDKTKGTLSGTPKNVKKSLKKVDTVKIRRNICKNKTGIPSRKSKGGGRRRETCTVCNKVISAYVLEDHMRIHTGEKIYTCEECGASFTAKGNLIRHIKTHSQERPYKCEICERRFSRLHSLREHIKKVHNASRTIICTVCSKHVKNYRFLKTHMSTIHGITPSVSSLKINSEHQRYTCSICGNVYMSAGGLKSHQVKHSIVPKPFLCPICGISFSKKQGLDIHQQIHTGEKRFKCETCHKQFGYESSLNKHVLIHSGAKPYSCHLCSKMFRQRSHLTNHLKRFHSAERPFKCTICQKSFKYNGNLNVHKKVHTGEKSYLCDVCNKGFYDLGSMKKHRKTHVEKKTLAGELSEREKVEEGEKQL